MVRSVIGVIVGYVLFAATAVALFASTGRDAHAAAPLWFMAFSTLYGMAFAAAGGYLTALIARRAEVTHGIVLAVLIAAGAVISVFTRAAGATVWSQLAALFLMAPCAVLGGELRRRQRSRGGQITEGGA